MNNRDEVMSINQLKLAYMNTSVTSDTSSPNNVPPTIIPETSSPSTASQITQSGCDMYIRFSGQDISVTLTL